jgi:hypothetical protein
MTDGCSEQTKSKKNAFTIGKLYGGLVFPALKHFILTSAPTASLKCCCASSGYDTECTFDRTNHHADVCYVTPKQPFKN